LDACGAACVAIASDAMHWTDSMLTDHLTDDVRFWLSITPI